MPHYTALVTLLAIGLYFIFSARVGAARGRFGVKQPATTGHPDFERIFRAHINTLEWLPLFLVPLWLFAFYLNDVVAAAIGVTWIVGRAFYFVGYSRSVERRVPGFLMQALACVVLYIGAVAGVVLHIAAG